ncbi:MAG: biotin/lipoate A/B protein ligase family protein [Methanomassiliicoccales archaeon]
MFWRLIDTDLASPPYTSASDEAMVRARQKNLTPNTLHFYRRDRPTVSLGYFQGVEESVNTQVVESRGIQLVRRFSGGSAIYTDQDQLIYSVILSKEFLPEGTNEIYERVCSAVIRGIATLGLEAEFKPVNDILINGRKVSGSAQKKERNVVIQHGTVIMDADLDLMFEVLKPGEKQKGKDDMTSLSHELGRKVEMEEMKGALIEGFSEVFSATIRRGVLTRYEKSCIDELVEGKYGSEKYTLSR